MRKFIAAIITFGTFTTIASADVVERKTCEELSASIAELAGRADELSEEEQEQLSSLRAQHRTNCTKRAAGRGARTIANARTPVKEAIKIKDADDDISDKGSSCASPDENGCCPGETLTDMGDGAFYCCETDGEMCFPAKVAPTPVSVTAPAEDAAPTVPQKTEEEIAAEIAANIEKGLCGDGSKPNKYGCCGDETFKDLGNLEFGCCPADGGDCYPPIK